MTAPVYPENTQVAFDIAVPQVDGAPLTVSSVDLTVLDEAGAVVAPTTHPTAPDAGAETFMVTVAPNLNGLAGKRRAARVVQVKFHTDQGVFESDTLYLIEAATQLQRLANSFVTMAEAQMVRRDMVNLDGWDAATDADRIAALVIAHQRLCRLTYKYNDWQGVDLQSRLSWNSDVRTYDIYVTDPIHLTQAEWDQLPDFFVNAIQRAQMAEADVLLKGDPVGEKRRSGIVSETIGESSMFFRQTPEVRLPISREAMEHLAGYVYRDTRISRA